MIYGINSNNPTILYEVVGLLYEVYCGLTTFLFQHKSVAMFIKHLHLLDSYLFYYHKPFALWYSIA